MASLPLRQGPLVDRALDDEVLPVLLPRRHRVAVGRDLERPQAGDSGLQPQRDQHVVVAVAVHDDDVGRRGVRSRSVTRLSGASMNSRYVVGRAERAGLAGHVLPDEGEVERRRP